MPIPIGAAVVPLRGAVARKTASTPTHNQFSRCRAGDAGSATHARKKAAAIFPRDISFSENAGNFATCYSLLLSVTKGRLKNLLYSPDQEREDEKRKRARRVAMHW